MIDDEPLVRTSFTRVLRSDNGIEVIQECGDGVSAEAFEANAADYILKPFGRDRLEQAISRAKVRVASSIDSSYVVRLLQALTALQRQQQYQDRIAVPVNGPIFLVPVKKY